MVATPLRDAFAQELAELGVLLLDQADEAHAALVLARRCVGIYDDVLVDAVGRRDRAAAQLESEVGRRVESLLARQAPVARDLRYVLAALEASHRIRRVAQNAYRAVRIARARTGVVEEEAVIAHVEEMADRAAEMLRDAAVAFARRDEALARLVIEEDEAVDRLHAQAADRVLDLGAFPRLRDWTIGVLFVARWFERAADEAVGVAEQVPHLRGAAAQPPRPA